MTHVDVDRMWQVTTSSWRSYVGDIGDPRHPDDVVAELTPDTVALVAAILTLAEMLAEHSPVFLETTPR
jgi:hypothetical protein